MTYLDPRTGTLNAKIVYYGLPSAGRSTNLLHIYDRVRPEDKSRLIRIATYEHHEQLFFDFLARSLSADLGRPLRLHLYEVTCRNDPVDDIYNLKGTDAVVAVVDSCAHTRGASAHTLAVLRHLLSAQDRDLDDLPLVFQYNKRDLPDALPIEELEAHLNPARRPHVEAIASTGVGVLETLRTVAALLLPRLAPATR
ncbi:MAG: gliding-motility protein MglA [Myxococcales bacterium]|nr:gliding-motility protein MglA [Myxococcales bacterium]